ncbi:MULTISPECIES: hypothetical protein [unclassified Sporosarcina]|uniref:hypothetical protein n=1 Tax=unclassified Sporosarcina TaxID=2647733 RepID=UPI0018EE1EB5|nr:MULTISPECIES: hypothetical protein [unclassified Sporosarcina]
MSIKQSIHLPDIAFVRLCIEEYGVNKGLYNTIDTFFYERGFEEIIERRKYILDFLGFVKKQSIAESRKVKFGSGGLRIQMDDYLDKNKIISINQYKTEKPISSRMQVY